MLGEIGDNPSPERSEIELDNRDTSPPSVSVIRYFGLLGIDTRRRSQASSGSTRKWTEFAENEAPILPVAKLSDFHREKTIRRNSRWL